MNLLEQNSILYQVIYSISPNLCCFLF